MAGSEQKMTERKTPPVSGTDISALAGLFEEFQSSTRTLQEAYDRLKRRVEDIDAELEAKNEELQQANDTLKKKMAELDEVRQYLANVLESMNSGVLTVGPDGRITMINPTASSWLQGQQESFQGKMVTELFPTHVAPCVLNSLKGGERFFDVQEVVVALDGTERFIRTNAAPLCSAGGERIGALMIFNDITQLRLLQEKARRQDRLTALGELAAGVAHEMRNPLTTIRGYIQILPTEIGDPEFQQEFLTEVLKEIDRVTALTDNLLDFSKPISANVQSTIIDDVVGEVVGQVIEQAQQKDVKIATQLYSDDARVLADRNRVKQVILNLLLNAFDAVSQGGSVRITSGREAGAGSPDGSPYYSLCVQDDGKGIPESLLTRLFDPFFTTKEKGTGLGLSLSNRIVQEHGGLIQVSSQVGAGTRFTVLLPLHAGGSAVDLMKGLEVLTRGRQST